MSPVLRLVHVAQFRCWSDELNDCSAYQLFFLLLKKNEIRTGTEALLFGIYEILKLASLLMKVLC